MQKIKKIYRGNYTGESIVTELVLGTNEWTPHTEFVPNSVFNVYSTKQAVAIGNGPTQQEFDLSLIAKHKGGLRGQNRLQSYGCNNIYEKFTPDFLVVTGTDKVTKIANTTYPDDNIVYVNAQHIIEYPGKFYLIPQNPSFDAGSLAAYLACFDGHKKVFLLGFDGYTDAPEHTFWTKTLNMIVSVYNDTEFIKVAHSKLSDCSVSLLSCPNFRQISFRDFVIEADIG